MGHDGIHRGTPVGGEEDPRYSIVGREVAVVEDWTAGVDRLIIIIITDIIS